MDLEIDHPSTSRDQDDSAEDELYVFLRGAREAAQSRQSVNLSVRDLISKWGFDRRSQQQAEQVRTELENFGLRADPDFVKVSLDERVALNQMPSISNDEREPEGTRSTISEPSDFGSKLTDSTRSGDHEPANVGQVVIDTRVAESADEVGLTLGNLVSPDVQLIAIRPEAQITEAITKMRLNDFSQMPVISGRNLYGALTWESIAKAMIGTATESVRDATVPVTAYAYDTDLIDALDAIRRQGFVLVRNAHQLYSGIVTASDVVAAYEELATPYFLVGELDLLLRRLVTEILLPEEIADPQFTDRLKISPLDKLSFGDYQSLLGRPEYWSRIGWSIDRGYFVERLNELRERRNDVMHFSPDPVPREVIRHLRAMISMVKGLGLAH